MSSFKELRELILLSYDDGCISDEEFVLLYDSYKSKNPEFPHYSYDRFDLEMLDETECFAEFRARKSDIPMLADVLQIPQNILCEQRIKCNGVEALCILLKRFSYPSRYSDMIPRFGRPVPEQLIYDSKHSY